MVESSKRIAVIGASGQLGSEVERCALGRGHTVGRFGSDDCDVRDLTCVRQALGSFEPDAIINTAAVHNLATCEQNPWAAMETNAIGAWNVARVAADIESHVTMVSTDYVFGGRPPHTAPTASGTKGAYLETDEPAPLNQYGRSKVIGEELVESATPNSLVVRVASLYGLQPPRGKPANFLESILAKAEHGENLTIVDDQWMSPTNAAHAAARIVSLVVERQTGIRHVTNRGRTTWYEFGTYFLSQTCPAAPVERASTRATGGPARRPIDSSLSSAYLPEMASWKDGVDEYIEHRARAVRKHRDDPS